MAIFIVSIDNLIKINGVSPHLFLCLTVLNIFTLLSIRISKVYILRYVTIIKTPFYNCYFKYLLFYNIKEFCEYIIVLEYY